MNQFLKPAIGQIFLLTFIILTAACSSSQKEHKIIVSNNSEIDRQNETVEVNIKELFGETDKDIKGLTLKEKLSKEITPFQLLDTNIDGVNDILLFQTSMVAGEQIEYLVSKSNDSTINDSKVFSRFVPERTDDYAWENDKVAFRTYGPSAQKMFEDGIKGGTLSSGIDCWLKKVDYPIINKWYAKHTSGEGSYHEDTGEGLDNFHVGSSRGCGGLGVYQDSILYISKNFTNYKTVSNGIIRTAFILDYANWQAGTSEIQEQKSISLDLGDNLMKVSAKISGTDVVAVGLTLHENYGKISMDTINGWFSYWQPHGDSELGTAIICSPKNYLGYKHIISQEKDKSHLLVFLKVSDGQVNYYTGFSWKKSGQYPTNESWEEYLNHFAQCKNTPLKVKIANN